MPNSPPDDPDLRRSFAEELRRNSDPEAVRVLARLLRDEDVDVRLASVESLHAVGEESATRVGGDSVATPEDCAMALTISLEDDNAHIRWRAAKALGSLGSLGVLGSSTRAVVSALMTLLADDNKHVAWAAADALDAIGDPEAVEKVLRFKQSRYRTGG